MAYPEADSQPVTDPHTDTHSPALAAVLSVASSNLYRKHPFRLTGLPVLASERDDAKRLELLRQSLALGTAEYRWAFAPGFAPSEDEYADIARSLKTPLLRLGYELFWFWPESYPDTAQDNALDCLARRDPDAAAAIWLIAAQNGSAIATHNLAVLSHLKALSGERLWSPHDEARRKLWRETLSLWLSLQENDSFWLLLEKRLLQLDDPLLPIQLIPLLRRQVLPAIAKINTQLASLALSRQDTSLALWHADLLHKTFSPPSLLHVLDGCALPIAQRIEASRQETLRCSQSDPAQGLSTARALLEFTALDTRLLTRLCGPDSPYVRDLLTNLASTALDSLVLYQRTSNDNTGCLPILGQLTTWSTSADFKSRLIQVHEVIAHAATHSPFPPADAETTFALNGSQFAISADGIRLDDLVIPHEQLTGLRFAPPLLDHPQPCTLGFWSADATIILETPAHIPADYADALALYNRILASCHQWLIPGIVHYLVNLIKNGESLFIGSTSLTAHGLLFTSVPDTYSGPKLVLYPDVIHVILDDQLTITCRSDTSLTAICSLREDWNAVIFPQLIIALTSQP